MHTKSLKSDFKKHRNYFDFYIAQNIAHDSEDDYCHKYIRGINDEKRKNS